MQAFRALARGPVQRLGPVHGLARRESSGLIFGGLAVSAAAVGAQYALAWQKTRAENAANGPAAGAAGAAGAGEQEAGGAAPSFTDSFFKKRFYEGPFESKMSRREAALILGVRESATIERIKEAHRRILRINHPDMGGSTFLAGKVNEAKELLIKGKEDVKSAP
ncbi:hypothetical protein M885DRAFT_514219 [Pelagophyceae sp. CCMP2097]|nr:hypothetical protein M885DRAFT_514219 [Pelagophyceae sp. CCMP2097]|mmetsp:Transcript_29417/g.101720  ORF Transcript_29417/g.101720 Transcript_29417/m.101720 type:complete len:165 (-) Transcript_29417:70-564(-)